MSLLNTVKSLTFFLLTSVTLTNLPANAAMQNKPTSPSANSAETDKRLDTVDGERIYRGKEVTTMPVMLKKPRPAYTDDARKEGAEGVVVLRAVLTAKGKVTNITVKQGLPHGLSEKAVEAAQQIKFKPAEIKGKPVSLWTTIMYNFNMYERLP